MAMENIDIKNFTIVQGLDDKDYVVLSLAGGTSGKILVRLMKNALTNHITPSIRDGVWWIGEINQGVNAIGQTPEFRKSELGIEYKYANEGSESWSLLVPFEDIKFKFEELTDEQKDELSLHFSDLTEDDIAKLQEPAKDMIAQLQATDNSVKSAETARVEEFTRLKSESETATTNAINAASEANAARDAANEATESTNIAIDNANEATTNANTATSNANVATENADKARNDIESLNQELKNNPPRITSEGTWKVWDAITKTYIDTGKIALGRSPIISGDNWWNWNVETGAFEDSGVTAIGKSPKIVDGTWWIWNTDTGTFEDTGVSTSSDYDDSELTDKIQNLQSQIDTLVSGSASDAIESFNEIIAFLQGITDSEDLDSILASIEQQIVAKQDEISDLDAIRSGASKGATALQSVPSNYVTTTMLNEAIEEAITNTLAEKV